MSHTPGPWRQDGGTIYWTAPEANNNWVIAQVVEPPVRPSEESLANARLIAAAPDLLKALLAGRGTHGELCHAGSDCLFIQDANAAIAKAEGREP